MDRFIQKNRVPRTLSALLLTLILTSTLLPSCNDNTITQPNTPEGSPSVSESSSPAPTEETPTPTPSDNYTDLPVTNCTHPEDDAQIDYAAIGKIFSKTQFNTFDLTEEDHAVLLKILNEGVWAEGTADIDSHYYLMAEPNGKIMYSKNGIFSDMGQSKVQKRHLVLTDRQRDTVNGILEKYVKEAVILEDQSDPNAVFSYFKEILDKDSMPCGKRTDFPDSALAEQISERMPLEELYVLLSSPHFSYRISGTQRIEPYIDYYILSNGSLLEIRLKTATDESGKTSTHISSYSVMTAKEFLSRYGLDPKDASDSTLSSLRTALPFCYSIGFLPKDANLADHLGCTADRTRTDLIAADKASSIKAEQYAGAVYELLGHPHLSLKYHSNAVSVDMAWFALSNGTFLQVQYTAIAPTENDPHAEARTKWGISEDAPIYIVKNVQILSLSEALDFALYENTLYPWNIFHLLYR
ncbi:MAG: hypothetical protein IJY89_00085 [Clostridia bacterium]|nr:hypothetical protein [Clostridia bacterium]